MIGGTIEMKKLLSLLMALMICLGIFTLAGGVHTVKAAEDDIASGTWKGVDWRITADGELILGNGGEQTFVNNDNIRNTYGWYHGNVDYRSSIKTVRVDGIVYIITEEDMEILNSNRFIYSDVIPLIIADYIQKNFLVKKISVSYLLRLYNDHDSDNIVDEYDYITSVSTTRWI